MSPALAPEPTLLGLSVLGAVLGLDVVSFPQAMLSRPLVAATLAGMVAGDAGGGLLVGATLELFALETLPVGASRYPEWGSAAVVGGALYVAAPQPAVAGLAVAVLASIATAWVGGMSMVALRKLNARWAAAHRARIVAGEAGAVIGLQMAGLGADLLRGFLMTVVALLVWGPVVAWVLPRVADASMPLTRAVTVGLAATVAGGAVWKLVHAVPRARWLFAAGLAAGLLLMVGLS